MRRDALGRAGFSGEVDTHFFERFGAAMLLSVVDDGLSLGVAALQAGNGSRSGRPMTAHDQRAVQAGVIRRLLQPLARFYDDDSLFEIIVNKPGELFVEGRQGWTRHEIPEVTLDSLMSFARAVATYSAQKVDATSPVLSATLPDGERIQIVIPPAVPAGTVSVTVRKPSQATFGLDELDAGGLFDEVVATGSELSASDQELGRLYKAIKGPDRAHPGRREDHHDRGHP